MKLTFSKTTLWLVALLMWLMFAVTMAVTEDRISAGSAISAPLVVVMDDSYPPYAFKDADGNLCGILPDQWALWTQKTGRKIELHAMDWADAQQMMREGQADVIDTMFQTEKRSRILSFTKPYARIRVPVYAHKTLGGISDTSSLKGFMVGIKEGDSAIDQLKKQGIDTLQTYPSYEAIILAAKRADIKVFTADEPAMVYYLYKHGIARDFNCMFFLYTGEMHRAVAKERTELLDDLQHGFSLITDREYRAIQRKWMGHPFPLVTLLRQCIPWLIALLLTFLILSASNIFLRRRVFARTAELRQALAKAKENLDAHLRSEQEKAEIQMELEKAKRLEAISRLAGTVAHDFNNMLQSILGYTELALDQVPSEHQLHQILKEIQNSAERSSLLTQKLQTFTHRPPASTKAININTELEQMRDRLERLLGDQIHLTMKLSPALWNVIMAAGQIDQVVTNLCINARDALEKQGTVTIETCNITLTPAEIAQMEGVTSDECVLLSIRDNGPGIPAENRDKVFDPFFTTKKSGQGAGLGLAIVYAIAKQNGGHIQLETKSGKGSTFSIYLPRTNNKPSNIAPSKELPAAKPGQMILLVDDEEMVLTITHMILEKLGYRVLCASHPDKAIQLFKQHQAEIDLLLTDVVMPDMSGPELAQKLQAQKPSLPCLFMSGHTANKLEAQNPPIRKGSYLPKPFNRQTLARYVDNALTKGTDKHLD